MGSGAAPLQKTKAISVLFMCDRTHFVADFRRFQSDTEQGASYELAAIDFVWLQSEVKEILLEVKGARVPVYQLTTSQQ